VTWILVKAGKWIWSRVDMEGDTAFGRFVMGLSYTFELGSRSSAMHEKLTISMVAKASGIQTSAVQFHERQGGRLFEMHTVGSLRSHVAIAAGLLLVSAPWTPTLAAIGQYNKDICKTPHAEYYFGKSWTPCSIVQPFCGKDGCCCVSPASEKCKKSKAIIDGKAKCEPFVK